MKNVLGIVLFSLAIVAQAGEVASDGCVLRMFGKDCNEEKIELHGDAAIVNDCTQGKTVRALRLSGNLEGGASVKVQNPEAFTFMAWMKLRGMGKGDLACPRLFSFNGNFFHVARRGIQMTSETSYAWRFGVSKKKFNELLYGDFYENEWVHVAFTCAGVSNAVGRVYVNGRKTDETSIQNFDGCFSGGKSGKNNAMNASAENNFCELQIGNEKNGKRPFEGDLTDVVMFNRILKEDEIASYARVTPDGKVPKIPPDVVLKDEMPLWDISKDEWRQTVIAQGTEEIYQGHPTTVRIPEDGTIYAVWTYNHGGAAGPMAMSKDDGKTWERIDERMPEVYAKKHKNCPAIYRIIAPDGKARLMIFSNKHKGGIGRMMSEDNGVTWRELPALPFRCGMPFTGVIRLKDGSTAAFGQTRLDPNVKTDKPRDDQVICMSVTKDGGFTWSPLRIIAKADKKNLCEPFALRSDDGNEICLLIRENRHTARSMMCFSRDEGETWSKPVDTCWGLSGDRHQGVRTNDGRWVIAFRDRALASTTYGQFVAWVGTYDDIRNARPGEFRIHLLDHKGAEVYGKKSWHVFDTGYPGMELLDDGTILATTYSQHTADKRKSSVVMTRFKLEERKKPADDKLFEKKKPENCGNFPVKIMSWNLRAGLGMDNVRDITRAASVIKSIGADVVALQEIDRNTTRSENVDQVAELEKGTGLHATWCKAIDFQGGEYGVALLSREVPLNVSRIKLPIFNTKEQRVLIVAEFEKYSFGVTHLSLDVKERMAALEELNKFASASKPFFLAGDWNDEPGSEFIQSVGKTFDILSGTNLTFSAPKPDRCIDYVAVSRSTSQSYKNVTHEVLPQTVISDHRPIVVNLR